MTAHLANGADSKARILLVDDQEEGLYALDATLAPLGQELVRARSGREALRHLLHGDFAVILLDVVMPDMDGFETAHFIRERERSRHIPIIFLTGLSEGDLPKLRAYAVGAVDYLIKPYEPEILRSKVNVFIDLYRKTELVRRQAEALRAAQEREHAAQISEARRRMEAEVARVRERNLLRIMGLGRRHRRWLEAVLTGLPTPLALVEPQTGRTLLANRAAQQLADGCLVYREAREMRTAYRFYDEQGNLLPDEQLPAACAARSEELSGRTVEWQVGDSRGAAVAFSKVMPRMYGHPATVLLVLLDVGPQRLAERHLQKAVKVRDDFLSMASHELKTPLTSLMVHIQGALRGAERIGETVPQPQYVSKLQVLQRGVSRLSRLVDDMLDLSRIASGRLDFDLSTVDLAEVVRDVAQRFEDEARRAGCSLIVEAAEPVAGRWDRNRVDQVVTNLLTNALKYGTGQPVSLVVRSEEQMATLEVSFRGIGIAPENQQRIFERFERAVAASAFPGFGLGLWIVSQIVTGLGGRVEVESRPGEGSTFRVALPLRCAAEVLPSYQATS